MRATRNLCIGALGAVLLWGAQAPAARATTEIGLSEQEMVAAADWIASAEVVSSRSEWIDGELWTRLGLEVSRTLKGSAERSATLMMLGGVDLERGIGSGLPGAPMLPVGSKLLVVGRKSPTVEGAYETIGLMQGLWVEPVENADPAQVVVPSDASLEPGAPQRDRVAAVLARIQDILARQKAAKRPGESR